jgi:two-component system sensor histidine kinase and response regulator WspE
MTSHHDTSEENDPILSLFRSEALTACSIFKQLSGKTSESGIPFATSAIKDFLGAARLSRVPLAITLGEQLLDRCKALASHQWDDFLLATSASYRFLESYLASTDAELLHPSETWQNNLRQIFSADQTSPPIQSPSPPVAPSPAISSTASVSLPPESEAPNDTTPTDKKDQHTAPIELTADIPDKADKVASELRIDPSLMELFLEEARAHTGTLNEGLVQLEHGSASPQSIEPLMRAAHSLKGAARVVGLDSCVEVAHQAEEVLVQAQHGDLTLNQQAIDVLLAATDYLAGAAEALHSNPVAWQASQEANRQAILTQLSNILARRAVVFTAAHLSSSSESTENNNPSQSLTTENNPTATVPPIVAATVTNEQTPKSVTSDKTSDKPDSPKSTGDSGNVVRVSAKSLSRLMNLAGESLVEARWLQPFSNSLLTLKRRQDQVALLLEELHQQFADHSTPTASGLQQAKQDLAECRRLLADRIGEFEEHARQSDNLNSRLYDEVIASRMRPFGDLAKGLPRLVRDTARRLNKQVQIEIHGEDTAVDRDILERLEAPLQHLLRNACDHGLELPAVREAAGKPTTGKLRVEAHHHSGMLFLKVSDDGRGISIDGLRKKIVQKGLASADMVSHMSEAELLEFLFLPGFSTAEKVTEVSGRGVGLDVVHHLVQSVGGAVRIQTKQGEGTTFILQLPITLSVLRAVLVTIGGEPYALPHNRTERLLRLPFSEIHSLEGKQFFVDNGRNVGLVRAQQLLELSDKEKVEKNPAKELSVVLIRGEEKTYGITVDDFKGELDLVVRPLDPRFGRVPNLSAAAILDNGNPVLILDVEDLLRSIDQILTSGKLQRSLRLNQRNAADVRKRILVVDDSITVRELQRQLLKQKGYAVDVAVDGADGLEMARVGQYDLIVSDIDMPRINGLEMIRMLKGEPKTENVPIIVVSYKGRDEDKQMGMAVGANYYLTKSSFQDDSYLDAIHDLIGDP